jgi:prepilin-type N-terminal cleavage/methylation domain-containing protein
LRPGFTLMEVLISIAIFSLAVTLTFSIITQASLQKRGGTGRLAAVTAVDDFLLQRRLQGDGIDHFLSPELAAQIRAGRTAGMAGMETSPIETPLSNGDFHGTLLCRAQVLMERPFTWRAFVGCRYRSAETATNRDHEYWVATVLVHRPGAEGGPGGAPRPAP